MIGRPERRAVVDDASPPASTQACINAIQANGGVVNDIFKDANGNGAYEQTEGVPKVAIRLLVSGKVQGVFTGCKKADGAFAVQVIYRVVK